MASIEQQFLQQCSSMPNDEDVKYQRHSSCIAPSVVHDGPQTGVKGVIADYRHKQLDQWQQHEIKMAAAKSAYTSAAQRNIQDEQPASDTDLLSNSEDDDDKFIAEYRNKRICELAHVAEKNGMGALRDATPDEYVDIVDERAQSGDCVVVVLVNASAASRRFESGVFLRVSAKECGFVDASVVPIVLVYRGGELKHNLVRVVDHLSDPNGFVSHDVTRLLDSILRK
ncbi:hypothetical protein BX661DRAFT_223944 [Kickxella alabastrina]|uniref:uncharacterized protein n=1 Tax=Kickxella alabastrina TaxID=61397 RepID=UPI00221F37DA|nr:uncharacterized protein BX661DRAFT_223944 [Kickxella alabastrina]KAI7830015.1 hypothetical protein BX661DRAFT_223944 [Kickxella alabastrina]